MCGCCSELQLSHIIPRSYFNSLKKGTSKHSGQLVVVSSDEKVKPELTNADPKEKLLCQVCEELLNKNYEQYGTRLLKDHKNVKRQKNYVLIKSFQYKKFYLYLISILWRASVSSETYPHVNLGKKIDALVGNLLINNTLKIQTSFRMDHFIRISLIRLTDFSNQLDDSLIKKVLVNIGLETGEHAEDGFVFYFMVDGFLITYYFSIEEDIHAQRTRKYFAQLRNASSIKVPIRDIREFKQISDGFSSISSKRDFS